MAIAAQTEWEVRDTDNDVNGGGFKAGASGTDYTQQDSARTATGTNDSTTDAVANGTTTITSATANFTAAIVGNIIYLAGGSGSLTATRREVVSRTNSTTIVVDANVASGTGITMNIGGGLATIGTAIDFATAQNRVWLKGSFTVTANKVITQSDSLPFRWEGYGSVRGDDTRATITTSTNSVDMFTITNNYQGFLCRNMSFSNTAGTRGYCFKANTGAQANSITFDNCIFDGFTSAIYGPNSGNFQFDNLSMINCEVKNSVSHGVRNCVGVFLSGCYIHDNGGHGVYAETGQGLFRGVHAVNCVFYKNTTDGVNSVHRHNTFWNCAFVDNTEDGLEVAAANLSGVIQNCIFYGNGGWGINFSTAAVGWAGVMRNCGFRSNTSGNYVTAALRDIESEITLTADPFNGRTTNDFSLNNTAGGGAALKAAGFQSTLIG